LVEFLVNTAMVISSAALAWLVNGTIEPAITAIMRYRIAASFEMSTVIARSEATKQSILASRVYA